MPYLTPILLLACYLGQASAATSPGCGKEVANVGLTTAFNVTSSNTPRNYLVHVPVGYDTSHQYPVVMAFHGNTETAIAMELDTRLSDPKWSTDKLVVYPDGINASWAGASYANTTLTQDLQFVSDVLSDLSSNFCVDSNRIYAAGFSNGGGIVDILACSGDSVGAQFAAFVAASGAYYQELLYNSTYQCVPAKLPTPIAFIHGLNDSDVLYNGGNGEGGTLPPVPAVVDNWVSRNRCTNLSTTDSSDVNGTVHTSSWTCAGVDGALQLYTEDNMGHVWASQQPTFSQIVIGEGPTKLEANDVLMVFFARFSLDKEGDAGSSSSSSSSFTAASSDLLPVTQTSTGTTTAATGSPTGTGGGPTPTASGNSAAGGRNGVEVLGLLNSLGSVAVALLWL